MTEDERNRHASDPVSWRKGEPVSIGPRVRNAESDGWPGGGASVAVPEAVTIPLSPKMREQFEYLTQQTDTPVDVLAQDLLAAELEAQAGLMRGPHLRKYMYR